MIIIHIGEWYQWKQWEPPKIKLSIQTEETSKTIKIKVLNIWNQAETYSNPTSSFSGKMAESWIDLLSSRSSQGWYLTRFVDSKMKCAWPVWWLWLVWKKMIKKSFQSYEEQRMYICSALWKSDLWYFVDPQFYVLRNSKHVISQILDELMWRKPNENNDSDSSNSCHREQCLNQKLSRCQHCSFGVPDLQNCFVHLSDNISGTMMMNLENSTGNGWQSKENINLQWSIMSFSPSDREALSLGRSFEGASLQDNEATCVPQH